MKNVQSVNSDCASDSAISCESVKLCESDELVSDEDLQRSQELEEKKKEIAAENEKVNKEELVRKLRTSSPEEVLHTLHQELEVLRAERNFRAAINSGNKQVIIKTLEEIKTLVTRKRQESRNPTEDEKAALGRLANILDERHEARKNEKKTSGKKPSMEQIRQQLLQEEIEERRKEKERKEQQQQEEKKKRQEEEERRWKR